MSMWGLVFAELKRILRNRFAIFVILLLPTLVILSSIMLFNSFAKMNLRIGVLNLDKDPLSRLTVGVIMSMFKGGTLSYVDQDYVERLMDGEMNAVVIIPENFTKNLYATKQTNINFVPSPVDFHLSVIAYQVFNSMFEDLNGSPFFDPQVIRFLFTSPGYPSPKLTVGTEERLFTLPSVLAPLAIFLTTAFVVLILSVQSVVRDEKQSLIEYYTSIGAKPRNYVAAKTISYTILGIAESMVALFILVILHVELPLLLVLVLVVLNSLFHAAFGVLLSSLSKTESVANLVGASAMIVTFFLSGMIVPIASIPRFVRFVAVYNPLFMSNYALRKAQMYGVVDLRDFLLMLIEIVIVCLSAFVAIEFNFKRR